MFILTLLGCADSLTDSLIDRELARLDDTSALEDGGLHVVLGGTGTLSTDDRAGSSVAVLAAGEVLVFDVGPGSTRGLVVTAFPVDHSPVPEAWGYRVDYNGRSVVISADAVPNQSLLRARTSRPAPTLAATPGERR